MRSHGDSDWTSGNFSFEQMGKSEQTPHRFRRKTKGPGSSSEARGEISSSRVPPSSTVDNLLCDNLPDSSVTSELTASSQLSRSPSTPNGTCDVELADSDSKGSRPFVIIGDDGVDPADPAPRGDLEGPKDSCLSSHLPAELAGLPRSEITPLCSNQSLDLSACHVQKEDSLTLVVFIYNSSSSDVQQILLELGSEQLEVR